MKKMNRKSIINIKRTTKFGFGMKMNIVSNEKIGIEEGDVCNRDGGGCKGIMVYHESENCSCHINAPCSSCTSVTLYCNECLFELENE